MSAAATASPSGIDVGLMNKYCDLALTRDTMPANHYKKLSVKASACRDCGPCGGAVRSAPQSVRMKKNAGC